MKSLLAALLLALPAAPAAAGVVINEIYADSLPNSLKSEFIELHNNGPAAVDLSGWRFTNGVTFTFPQGTVLPAGDYTTVAENLADFNTAFNSRTRSQVIAHWSFDETSGTTADGEKPATATGGVNQEAEGRFGGSGIAMDGVAGSYLTIPPLTEMWGSSYTMAAWVKPADTTPNAILADIASPGAFLFSVDTAARMSHRYNSATPATAAVWTGSGGVIQANTWQHIAAVWDREAQVGRVYLNGVMVYRTFVGKMPAELKMVQNNRPWNIGRKQDNNECFNGLMDELWVIKGALSGAAINILMNTNAAPASYLVDLADITGGGNGSLPGTGGEGGIDAANGLDVSGNGAGDHPATAPGAYSLVAHPMIDGVFLPNNTIAGGQRISSTGLTVAMGSGDGDPTPGYWLNSTGLMGDPTKVNSEGTFYLPHYPDDPINHSLLTGLTQKGISYDLDAIEANWGGEVIAFTAVAGESRLQIGGTVAVVIFVDGVERFRQSAMGGTETVIDVSIPTGARFLTLVITNSDGNNANDHGFFADPFLHLVPTSRTGPPRQPLGPYAGTLSGNSDLITLVDSNGSTADEVDYQTEFPWPIAAGGEGNSLELLNPGLDNQLGGSWRSSFAFPTPGLPNSVFTPTPPPQIRQVDHSPKMPPANQPLTITAKITDPDGMGPVELKYQLVLPGKYIPARLALTSAQVIANPYTPRTANPAFENPANWSALPMVDDGTQGDAVASDSIYTAIIPGQINRTLIRYRITASDIRGSSVRVPYADDASLNFAAYAYSGVPDYVAATRSVTGRAGYVHPKEVMTSLPVYSLLTNPADLTKSIAYDSADQIPANNFESREAFNWDGAFVYNGTVYDHIRYRLRQRNDRYGGAGKRSFRFRFNRGNYAQFHDFEGNPYPEKWRSLNTHKGSARGGPNMGLYEMANSVLWRVFGVPAPATHWFHFRVVDGVDEAPAGINGQHLGDFFGLLLGVEDYDSRFLSARKLPPGNIYKLNSYILNGNEVQRYQAGGSVTDGSDFYNILNNLRSTRTEDWLNTHVDYPAWYRYHTVVDAVRHYDVQPNTTEHLKNRTWYFRPDPANPLGKLMTLPWDSDTSWGPNWNGGEDFSKAAAITPNRPNFVREYRNVVREFRDLVWQRDQIEPMLNLFQARLAAIQLAERDRWTNAPANAGSQTDGPIADKIADMKKFAFIGGAWDGGSDDPQDAASKDSGISGLQGRDAYLDFLQNDAAIPATPTLTYSGSAGFPSNGLTFTSSAFSDPQGPTTFGGMEWRVAEYLPNAIQPDPEPLIPAKSSWKYHDRGQDLGTAWRDPAYDDSSWASGAGELGYGETGLGTTLSWGPDTANRYPTYYFRKTISVPAPARFTSIQLGVKRDDGAIVYLNGTEIFRTNLAAAPTVISYTTRALTDVTGTNETAFFNLSLPASAFVIGENTIAVELHQFAAASPDLRFDLTLSGILPVPPVPTSITWEYEHRWKSPVLTTFSPTMAIPPTAVRENRTYRARVRHQDSTGRWSHWSAPLTFLTTPPGIQPLLDHLAISEILYDPANATPVEALAGWTSQDFEWVELENRSSSLTLDLTDVRFTNGINVDIPPGTQLPPGGSCLVVRSRTAFELRYGPGLPVVGEFSSSRLDNGGEPLKLSFGGGVPVREFRYDDDTPWPAGARSTGSSISFLPATALTRQGEGQSWRSGPPTPGAPNRFPTGWDAWAQNYFRPGDSDYLAKSGPNADPDGDGQPNLLEYALGSAPNQPVSPGSLQPGLITLDGTPYFTISCLDRPDLLLLPEISTTLDAWQPHPMLETARLLQPDGSERITLRSPLPVSTSKGRFLRLKVARR